MPISQTLIVAAVNRSNPDTTLAPPLKNRLICMLYEGMLLFGVVFTATLLFSTVLEQRHALYLRDALQDWLFIVLGVYFIWFWTRGGQTLAMKTWRLRVVDRHGARLSWSRALLRYVLVWLWFLPGLALARSVGAQGWMLVLLPALNFVLWAAAVYLHPERQFLHDRLAGTRLILVPAPEKNTASAKSDSSFQA
jgi:uncharacterized RDD family membrane protein YckC